MASLLAGTYRIVSAKGSSSSPYCLDVSGGSCQNGANVQIYRPNYTDAQYYKVTIRSNGTYRILSRLSGKSLDVAGGTIASDTNVQQWNSNNTRAQSWVVVPDGNEATYQGETYETYVVTVQNTSLALDIAGGTMASGTNVRIHTANGTEAQRWMFVPMPEFESGGIYELRSLLKTSMAVDVASDTQGANVQLMAADDSNSQKFYLTEEDEDHWSILNVSSGMYVDVKGGASAVGTNVQQWPDNDGRAQRWLITQYGTKALDGMACAVVTFGSWVAGSGLTRNMDVYNALTGDRANIDIDVAGGETKQRFVLYRSNARDATLPVPIAIGWCDEPLADDRQTEHFEAETLYPSWDTVNAWSTDAAGHYEERHRVQLMGGASGAWGEWGEWTEWSPVAAVVAGQTVWMADGLDASVGADSRAKCYEIQVRACVPGDDGNTVTGIEQDETLVVWVATTVDVPDYPGFGPDGMAIGYESDYAWGTTNIVLQSLHVTNTGEELLVDALTFSDLDPTGNLAVPVGSLTRWLDAGELLTAVMDVSNDVSPTSYTECSVDMLPVTYDTTPTLTVVPYVIVSAGRTLTVGANNGTVTRAWIEIDGELKQMTVKNGTATLLYPFSASFDVWAYVQSANGTEWGIWHRAYRAGDLVGSEPAHVWNWNGGSFVLEMRRDVPLETDYSVQNDYAEYSLNNRAWQTVHVGTTKQGRITAEGSIGADLDSESTRDALDKLLDACHVTYRSPHGLMFKVAVVEASMECSRGIWDVSVTMIREVT